MTREIQLVTKLKELGLTISTAESVTGGLVSATIVNVPGASQVFKGGFITYAASVKSEILGVPQEVTEKKGVVSAETAKYMAEGAAKAAHTDVALSTTGNAGPHVLEYKPVGRIYTAVTIKGETTVVEHTFSGDREQIRKQTVNAVIRECLNRLEKM